MDNELQTKKKEKEKKKKRKRKNLLQITYLMPPYQNLSVHRHTFNSSMFLSWNKQNDAYLSYIFEALMTYGNFLKIFISPKYLLQDIRLL